MSGSNSSIRKGLKDLWGARLVRGAEWTAFGNPVVATTMPKPPTCVVGYRAACRIHRERISSGKPSYRVDALVHTFTDDQNFDGARTGIWSDFEGFVEVITHFAGVCVDLSIYADMPEPVMRWQIYRMRALEFALAREGVPVVVNARWGGCETWAYTIDELPERSMLVIGTVASGLKRLENRPGFEAGMRRLLAIKRPACLLVVGSASNSVFDEARELGTEVIQFDGETCAAYKKRAAKVGEADV